MTDRLILRHAGMPEFLKIISTDNLDLRKDYHNLKLLILCAAGRIEKLNWDEQGKF